MRDEQVGQLELVLQVHQQIDDLRLDRHVQRGHRFVADDQLRTQRQRAGDADALALAAGELVRERGHVLRSQADALEQIGDAFLRSALLPTWWMISGSPTMSPADMRGFSDA